MAWGGSRGIRNRAYLVPEDYTSLECSLCGEMHSKDRIHRGLYICRASGRRLNPDLNASNNIARRLGCKVEIRKIMSCIATCNGLKPITPGGGVMRETLAVETPPLRAGRGHSCLWISIFSL